MFRFSAQRSLESFENEVFASSLCVIKGTASGRSMAAEAEALTKRQMKGRKSAGTDWHDVFDVSRRINKRPSVESAKRHDAPWAEDEEVNVLEHFSSETHRSMLAGVTAQEEFSKCLKRQLEQRLEEEQNGGNSTLLRKLAMPATRRSLLSLRREGPNTNAVKPDVPPRIDASSPSNKHSTWSYRCPSTNDLGVYDIEKSPARKNMFHQVGKKVFPEGFQPLPGDDPTAASRRRLGPIEAYKERRIKTIGDRSTLPNEWDVRVEFEEKLKRSAAHGCRSTPPPMCLTPAEMRKASMLRDAPPPRSISVLTERKIDSRVDELIREHREGLRRHRQIMAAVSSIPLRDG